ncbi:MAG: CDP-diacylglycerol--serine O-phosphatidyltransferase [Chloroflexi bacterium]|nr:CDP-diacylglycerol--serine O-phosphatidyltransferase [Chloroflexota bacterium]
MFTSLFGSPRVRAILPGCVTLLAMFCGYVSVTFTLKGAYITAAWLIVCGGILDALDGSLARLLRADTKFGGELDSFADLVSFGIAPSLLFYRAYFSSWGTIGVLLSFAPTMMGALRLTRYNLTDTGGQRDYFSGFTTTASASLLASFLLFNNDVWGRHDFPDIAAALVLLCSILMVSRVRYATLARLMSTGVWRPPKGILLLPLAVSIVLFPAKAFFPAMLVLMLEGLLHRPIGHALHHVDGIRRQHRGA